MVHLHHRNRIAISFQVLFLLKYAHAGKSFQTGCLAVWRDTHTHTQNNFLCIAGLIVQPKLRLYTLPGAGNGMFLNMLQYFSLSAGVNAGVLDRTVHSQWD